MSRRKLNTPMLAVLLLLLLGLPVGIGVASIGSGANFADNERFVGNRLGAGSVDVEINDRIDTSAIGSTNSQLDTSKPTVFSAANLAPGDQVTGALLVNNDGTLPLRFWVTAKATTSSGNLGDWLLFDGWVAADCRRGLDGANQVFSTNVVLGATHTRMIGTDFGAAGELRLEPGEESVVCLGAHLPLAAPNEVQAASVEVELIVVAQHALDQEEETE